MKLERAGTLRGVFVRYRRTRASGTIKWRVNPRQRGNETSKSWHAEAYGTPYLSDWNNQVAHESSAARE
eukprot:scaffold163481_cov18-Prasinocladus_malaysianus.AAC.1